MLTATPALASSSNNQKTEHSYFSKLAAKSRATNTTYKAGQYIVRLKAQPASTYTGGLRGFGATKPSAGKQLNANTDAVKSYSAHLKSTQVALAGKFGFKALYNYTLAYNGFAAKLTAAQANALAKNSAVSTLTPSKLLKVQVAPSVTPPSDLSSIKYLNIDTGVWDKNGGPANAGKGVVLGDIDTGIAPENPSFAGDPLETASTASTTPAIIDGGGVDNVQFKKADGGTFSSTIIPDAPGWTSSDLSTKIIGAHFFVNGFGVGNLGSTAARGEYVSPRDGAGHGSHTASTAAGDYGVDATVAGTDFGGISGVAPAAKISVYKVCWDGPALDESQDGCAESDMVAAIDQAVRDGVDVLNFSIGGGAAVTTFSPTDEAFYNAASAGIFVAAAGGNAGPDSSTLDNASPWETTVAASTIPSYEATATLGNGAKYAGASNTVGFGTLTPVPDNSVLVDAKTHTAGGSTSTISALCGPNSLDDATVTGKVVLCDRGTYDRVAKSAEVLRAGGIGMILVNVVGGANDVDLDQHSVPTIHVSNAFNAALHAYAATATPTVSFSAGNTSPIQTPVPQIAGFSSRGPVQADGSDILKPDVAAPGVAILAAVYNGPVGGLNPAP
ncbi:MAG: serine protease [Glaciihabitans sp.]|nr:serine protease [Glaciihabitans sp.]